MIPTVTCSPDSGMVTGSNPEAQGSYCFWAMDIIRDLGCGRASDQVMVFGTPLDVTKALGGCTCHSDQHSPAAGWSLDNSMTPGGCPEMSMALGTINLLFHICSLSTEGLYTLLFEVRP